MSLGVRRGIGMMFAMVPTNTIALGTLAPERVKNASGLFTQRLQGMGDAALMAMKQLSQIVHRQAVVMGYGDAFLMLTVFYFGRSLLVLLLNKPSAMAAGGDAH